MNKMLIRAAIVLCLFFFEMPNSFCQDNQKEKPKKEVNTNDADDDNTVPQEEEMPVKKKVRTHQRVLMGVEAGPSVTLLNIGSNATSLNIGGQIGAYAEIRMAGKFYVEPGIYYVMNGGGNVVLDRVSPYALSMRINTVEIPVTVSFKTGKPGDRLRFTAGAGGYFGYNAGGDINGVRLLVGDATGNDIKSEDAGIAINVGLELRNGLFFHMKSQQGLFDLQPNTGGAHIYTASDAITIGCYLFGRKKHHVVRNGGDSEYIQRGN